MLTQNVTKEQIDVLTAKVQRIQERIDDVTNQLDVDRKDIDLLKVELGTIKEQQHVIIENFATFKDQIRQTVADTVASEVARCTKKELNKIEIANPKKIIVVYRSFWDWIRNLLKKNELDKVNQK